MVQNKIVRSVGQATSRE